MPLPGIVEDDSAIVQWVISSSTDSGSKNLAGSEGCWEQSHKILSITQIDRVQHNKMHTQWDIKTVTYGKPQGFQPAHLHLKCLVRYNEYF